MVSCLIYSKISEELRVIFMAIDTNYEMQTLACSEIDCSIKRNGNLHSFCQDIQSCSAIFTQVLGQKTVFW